MNKLTIIFILVVFQFSAFGQRGGGEIKEQIESRKIAFLSDRLDLSPEEAQRFWPVYNMYMKEIQVVKDELWQHRNKDQEIDDAMASEILDKRFILEEKTLSIKKKYVSKMKDIIGAKRTLMLFHSERKFKESLFESAKERRKRNYKEGR